MQNGTELTSVFSTNYSNYNTWAVSNEQNISCFGPYSFMKESGVAGRTSPAAMDTWRWLRLGIYWQFIIVFMNVNKSLESRKVCSGVNFSKLGTAFFIQHKILYWIMYIVKHPVAFLSRISDLLSLCYHSASTDPFEWCDKGCNVQGSIWNWMVNLSGITNRTRCRVKILTLFTVCTSYKNSTNSLALESSFCVHFPGTPIERAAQSDQLDPVLSFLVPKVDTDSASFQSSSLKSFFLYFKQFELELELGKY